MKKTLAIFFILPLVLFAQEQADTVRSGYLTLRSQPIGATVFLDSAYVGQTPLSRLTVPAGDHQIRAFHPSPLDWNAFVQTKQFHIDPGTEIESSFEFGSLLTLHSVPSGATVSYQGSDIGRTPLYYRSNVPIRGALLLALDDYKSETIQIKDIPSVVRLTPTNEISGLQELIVEYPSESAPRKWATFSSAAGMIISGVAAAYFKDRANRQYEQYSTTNDPDLLNSTHRFDRLSLISLIVTQASFAFLTYSLLSTD